jgi:hypothetical protein
MMSTGHIERIGLEEFRISIKQFSEQSKPKQSIRLLPYVKESYLNLLSDIFSLDGSNTFWRPK